jgi:hypothetical protein
MHHCEAQTFIQRVGGGEYVVSNIKPSIKTVVFSDDNADEFMKQGQRIVDNLITSYFPRYSKGNGE